MRTIIVTALMCFGLSSAQISHAEEDTSYLEQDYWKEYAAPSSSPSFSADIGLHMTPSGFGTQVSLFQFLTSYFQVGQSFQYYRNEEPELGDSQLHYGADLNMRLAPFLDYMFAPYASVAFGYNQWHEAIGIQSSARANYDLGLLVQLSKYLSLNLVHKEISFMDQNPSYYWGQKTGEKTISSNEAIMTFSLNNKMF